jgi:hypothetical protein
VLCARRYGRDCQFNEGHELGRIPADEILQTRLDALIYREYLVPDYTTPNPVPLVPSDNTEPPWSRHSRRLVGLDRRSGADLGDVFDARPGAARQSGVASGESAEAVYLPGS